MAGQDVPEVLRCWTEARTPDRILRILPQPLSDRKLRLVLCAALRRLWPLLLDPRSRRAVEAVERFADGATLDAERQVRSEEASAAYNESRENGLDPAVANAAFCITYESPPYQGREVAFAVFEDCRAACERNRHLGFDPEREQLLHCQLLKCVFGNPVGAVPADPTAWRIWHEGAIVKLASVIYEKRRFDELPILADALEDAGCKDPSILGHCRDEGAHSRGCWVLDLVLGRGDV